MLAAETVELVRPRFARDCVGCHADSAVANLEPPECDLLRRGNCDSGSSVTLPMARVGDAPDVRWAGARRCSRVALFDRYIATKVQRTIEPVGVRLQLWDG